MPVASAARATCRRAREHALEVAALEDILGEPPRAPERKVSSRHSGDASAAAGALELGRRELLVAEREWRATAFLSSRTLPGQARASKRGGARGRRLAAAAERSRQNARARSGDVAARLRSGGSSIARDGEAVEEVVAEAAGLHLAIEIAPRRGEDAHVDADPSRRRRRAGPRSARARARSFGWSEMSRSPISSMRSVPPCGLLEDAAALARRAGEGAALVAEELGLEQVRRDGGAVEDDERPCRARALLVERLGEELFAGAGLAFDEDGTSDAASRSKSG